jgi:DNA recombination protein RmuC
MPAAAAPFLPLILVALAGAAGGALLAWALLRGRIGAALAAGRASREPEIAILGQQREAAIARGRELAERIVEADKAAIEAAREARQLATQAAAAGAQVKRLEESLADACRSRDHAQSDLLALTGRHSALEASAAEQSRAAAEKLQLLDQAEQRLRDAFQNLAQRILDDKAEHLRAQSAQQLGGLLDPLKGQLKEFRDSITQVHATEQRERGMLAQEIQSLRQLNQRISEDAINLTRALKGDTRAQGAWGELVLERVLEASGLQAGREYTTQASFSTAEGARQRPDVIVHLPDGRDIVIDAKVSLVAYERHVAAPDDPARAAALADHVASVRRHIEGLSLRRYDDIEGLRTLDFVLLFIPVEAAFIEAVRADERLFTHALGKNISITSPSTLLATLRTIAHLWRLERRNVNAMEIARRAARLHDNFALLVDELEAVGTQLARAQAAQASALRRLTQGGKGSVLLQVQSLAEMGAPVKKELPAKLLGAGDEEVVVGEEG